MCGEDKFREQDTTPEQRRAARQAYDRRDLLADDECPLEDIALDADALALMGSVLADIDDLPVTTEGAQ